MSSFSELKESINKQFIPLYDSILFIAKYGKGTLKDGLNLLKTKLLDKQIYLLLVDEFSLIEIKLFQDDYEAVEYDGKYITVNFILAQLEKSIANNKATADIANYGFGAKRFYETLSNSNGIFKIDIPNEILKNSLSPDCYHDTENPLTQIVQELQKENALLKQQQANPPKLNNFTESYITLDEAIAYLSKILDLTIINPIHFLERNIKQGVIIPFFEYYGFIHFETPTDKFSTVIQICEVHGYFKDWNYRQPDNQFTDLSKNEYTLATGGKVDKLFFSDCVKFYGRLRNGNEHFEPNEAIEPPKDITVTFYNLMPTFRDYGEILRHKNDTETINRKAIHFKQSDIELLTNQNSFLKISPQFQTDSQLSQQVADQQATIDSQAKEIADLKAQLKPQAAQPSKTPVNNKQLSNVEISNIYGKAIIANNNILAKVIKTLDYRDLITREQIANFINPYMWEMALILSDDDEQKAESLMVTNKTIMDNHLKGVKFKKGAPNKQDKTKPSIDLIINRDELN